MQPNPDREGLPWDSDTTRQEFLLTIFEHGLRTSSAQTVAESLASKIRNEQLINNATPLLSHRLSQHQNFLKAWKTKSPSCPAKKRAYEKRQRRATAVADPGKVLRRLMPSLDNQSHSLEMQKALHKYLGDSIFAITKEKKSLEKAYAKLLKSQNIPSPNVGCARLMGDEPQASPSPVNSQTRKDKKKTPPGSDGISPPAQNLAPVAAAAAAQMARGPGGRKRGGWGPGPGGTPMPPQGGWPGAPATAPPAAAAGGGGGGGGGGGVTLSPNLQLLHAEGGPGRPGLPWGPGPPPPPNRGRWGPAAAAAHPHPHPAPQRPGAPYPGGGPSPAGGGRGPSPHSSLGAGPSPHSSLGAGPSPHPLAGPYGGGGGGGGHPPPHYPLPYARGYPAARAPHHGPPAAVAAARGWPAPAGANGWGQVPRLQMGKMHPELHAHPQHWQHQQQHQHQHQHQQQQQQQQHQSQDNMAPPPSSPTNNEEMLSSFPMDLTPRSHQAVDPWPTPGESPLALIGLSPMDSAGSGIGLKTRGAPPRIHHDQMMSTFKEEEGDEGSLPRTYSMDTLKTALVEQDMPGSQLSSVKNGLQKNTSHQSMNNSQQNANASVYIRVSPLKKDPAGARGAEDVAAAAAAAAAEAQRRAAAEAFADRALSTSSHASSSHRSGGGGGGGGEEGGGAGTEGAGPAAAAAAAAAAGGEGPATPPRSSAAAAAAAAAELDAADLEALGEDLGDLGEEDLGIFLGEIQQENETVLASG